MKEINVFCSCETCDRIVNGEITQRRIPITGENSLNVELGDHLLFNLFTAEVTEVREERLQAVTVEDAKREGMVSEDPLNEFITYWNEWERGGRNKHGWFRNPWVKVIAFKVLEKTIISSCPRCVVCGCTGNASCGHNPIDGVRGCALDDAGVCACCNAKGWHSVEEKVRCNQ